MGAPTNSLELRLEVRDESLEDLGVVAVGDRGRGRHDFTRGSGMKFESDNVPKIIETSVWRRPAKPKVVEEKRPVLLDVFKESTTKSNVNFACN